MSRARSCAVLAAGLGFGVALRLYVAAAAEGKSFSDNAVVALMAMHALRGKLYAFYWGQSYMGSLEAVVVAPFFALFGVGDLALSAGLLPWYLAYAAALYAIVRRIGGELAGALALVFCALAPSDVQFFEVTARGGYPATISFGTILLWLSLRFAYDPLTSRWRTVHVTAIGVVAGLAFWTNWLILPYFVVCAPLLLLRDPGLPLRPAAAFALGAFVLGSAPLWVFNVRHGFPTFALVGVPDAPSAGTSLRWAFELGIPNVLGVRDLHGAWAFGPAGAFVAAAAVAASLLSIHRLGPSWLAIGRGRLADSDPTVFLWLLAIATVAIYVSTLPSRFQIGRYLLPLTTSGTALLALGGASLHDRRPAIGVGVIACLAAFYGAGTVKLAHDFRSMTERYTAGPVDKLVPELEAAGIRFGYASYADAAIATYIAAERVVLADYEERYYPLDEVAFRDPALVIADGTPPARRSLEAVNARFRERTIRGYRIYWPIGYDGIARRPLDRRDWQISASLAPEDASSMVDGDLWSAWSVDPRGAPPVVTIDLGREQPVSGVQLTLDRSKRDGFVRLRVEASTTTGEWHVVKEAGWDFPVYFRPDGRLSILPDNVQTVLFAPEPARRLRLTLLEANSGRNWTIGELSVFGVDEEGAGFVAPAFADPQTPALAERRLHREFERDPSTDRPLVELEEILAAHGEATRAGEVAKLAHDRFAPRTLLEWRFGRDIRLVGYDLQIAGPRELAVTYYWRGERRMRETYAMTGRLEGSGRVLQDDYVIGAPSNPSGGWLPGQTVKQTRRITLPADAPPGRYAFEIGVWAPASGARLRRGGSWLGERIATLFEIDLDGPRLVIVNE